MSNEPAIESAEMYRSEDGRGYEVFCISCKTVDGSMGCSVDVDASFPRLAQRIFGFLNTPALAISDGRSGWDRL